MARDPSESDRTADSLNRKQQARHFPAVLLGSQGAPEARFREVENGGNTGQCSAERISEGSDTPKPRQVKRLSKFEPPKNSETPRIEAFRDGQHRPEWAKH